MLQRRLWLVMLSTSGAVGESNGLVTILWLAGIVKDISITEPLQGVLCHKQG
ncbi:hypothetical protein HMPREF1545_03087 [Oscillibacter sp. KLE 1728]|nr:hypothetical protein HMPREF1545_03087 [Oscillibacter sp. KLE 1728]ERK58677.1 hypothetical protein HMPREF1546_03646 [Oscillibacter sp. KLE 1745]